MRPRPLLLVLCVGGGLLPSVQARQSGEPTCASRIVPYSRWELSTHHKEYLHLPSRSGGALYFLGARHTFDPEDLQRVELENAFRRIEPTLVYYEGHERGIATTAEETIRRFGEPGLVRYLAKEDGVPTRSLEPSPSAEISHLLERFDPLEVELTYLLQQAAMWRERKGYGTERLEEEMAHLLHDKELPSLPRSITTVSELQEAYEQWWNRPPSWWQAPMEWFNPRYSSRVTGGRFTNEIARAAGDFRNVHMLDLLSRAAERGERVLAVAGGAHVAMLEQALRCALAE